MKDNKDNNLVPIYSKMFDDFVKVRQPENTYTYALNSTIRNNILSREEGFKLKAFLPVGYKMISTARMIDNKRVVFSTNGTTDEIGIFNGQTYTTVVNAKLNFKLTHKIDCTYRLRNGCEDCIYFTDYLNPVRYFNFSRPLNFKTNGNWNANKFSLVRYAKFPKIHNIKVHDTGAQVKAGAVIFGIRYLDDDLNPTHFVYTTHPVLLFKSNNAPSLLYETQYVGKSVSFEISNLDTDFKYYQIGVAYINAGNGDINEVFLTERINIVNKKFTYTADTAFIQSSITELTSKVSMHTALTVDQIDNQLILGNIKEENIPADKHQKYASKIGVGAVWQAVGKEDVSNKFHPENPNYLQFASHMANEVIALAITYVDSNTGKESGPYHIPGRPLDKNPYYCSDLDIVNGNDVLVSNCMRVTMLSRTIPGDVIKIDYTIIEDGVVIKRNTDLLDLFSEQDKYREYVKCVEAPKTITLVEVRFLDTDTLVPPEMYEVEYYQSTTNVTYNTLTLDGWDSTVYTTGERDVVAITDNDAYFNEVVRAFLDFYGTSVVLSDANLNKVEFKNFFKSKILEGVYNYPLKWEVYNTAKLVENNNMIMGYYETKNSFYENPLQSSCLEEDYWGYDICGEKLINKRIRHHRFPDRNLIPINDVSNLFVLGLEFFNIEYPAGYDSHYFSCAIKTENDKTVLDNGIVTKQLKHEGVSGSAYLFNYLKTINVITNEIDAFKDSDVCGYYSPFSLNNSLIANGYLKYYYGYKNPAYNSGHPSTTEWLAELNKLDFQEVSKLYGADDTQIIWFILNFVREQLALADQPINLPIKRNFNIPVAGYEYDTIDGYKIVNASLANRLSYFKGLERDLFRSTAIGYASIMINKDVYFNLDTITYRRLHLNNLTINESQIVFGGDTYITKFNLVNYTQATYKGDTIGKIVAGFSAALNAAASTITTGNPLIVAGAGTAALIAGLSQSNYSDYLKNVTGDAGYLRPHVARSLFSDGGDGIIGYIAEILNGIYIDSYINFNLRFDGNDESTKVLRSTVNSNAIVTHLTNKLLTPAKTPEEKEEAPKSGMVLRTLIAPETYFYYDDFSPTLYAKRYYGIPSTYNYCSECKELYPTRLYYSLQSFQEELTDNYRQILPNNYKDVQSEFGEIIDVFKKDNKLFISLKESLLEQPRNYQERITNDLVTFIGTGEFLELPAGEVIPSEIGKLGNTNKEATVVVPEGLLFVDEYNLKIYLISASGFKNLASEEYGYKETLERIIPIRLNKVFTDIDIKTNSHYCGYLCTYDEIEKRFLITKKDFLPKPDINITYVNDNFIVIENGKSKIIDVRDTNYFYDLSWTLSFSILTDGFVSFHSYIPDNYIPFKNALFLNLDNNDIWKAHTKGIYTNYFNKQYPHIVEFCINNVFIKHVYNMIRVALNTVIWNDELNDYVHTNEHMFNKLLVYNERQCSGYIQLDLKDEYSDLENPFYRTDSININYFRDISNPESGQPLFIQNDTVDFKLSNKLLNELSLNYNTDWHEEYYFKGKYLVIRLIIDNFETVKFETDISTIFKLPSLKY